MRVFVQMEASRRLAQTAAHETMQIEQRFSRRKRRLTKLVIIRQSRTTATATKPRYQLGQASECAASILSNSIQQDCCLLRANIAYVYNFRKIPPKQFEPLSR